MKKIIVVAAVIVCILSTLKSGVITIPKESIRFRVIANSNTQYDQNIKKEVVKNLESELRKIELVPKDILSTRTMIKRSIPTLEKSVENTLNKLNVQQDYSINYGMNYFPQKESNNVIYEEGEYESVVVKLGEGKGDNFWCVLFPPLCLLEGEEGNNDDVEYTSFIKELINKYF
ncbi:MAG: stage II sporulation protein R [Bacilli bacterium]|nr:stage II sporulation protein R [Bacilli bacterium]